MNHGMHKVKSGLNSITVVYNCPQLYRIIITSILCRPLYSMCCEGIPEPFDDGR